jgi:Dolichyl-phosphate-mannose-protein mannosyltransferase
MIPGRPTVSLIALFACAAATAWFVGPSGPAYWDTFGYVTQALTGQIGGLGLGRPLFVWVSFGLAHGFLAIGGSVWQVEPILRIFWLLVAATAAPATWRLAQTCGLSRRAALLTGLAVAVSPAMAHTAANVLTDGPAAALVVWALVAGGRAVQLSDQPRRAHVHAWLAGTLLGAACGLREESALFVASLALMWLAAPKPARRGLAVRMMAATAAVTIVPVVLVARTQPGYAGTIGWWLRAVIHTDGIRDPLARRFAYDAAWLVAFGPIVAAAAAVGWLRQRTELLRRHSLTLAVCAPAAAQLLALAFYPEISYGPRYLAAVFPGAIALPAGLAFDRWAGTSGARLAAVAAGLLLPVLVAHPLIRAREGPLRQTLTALPSALLSVPAGSVIVTGQPCPAIPLVEEELRRDPSFAGRSLEWDAICPGSAWPADLAARLDAARAAHRTIVLDLRASSWLGVEQQHSLALAARYRDTHPQAAASGEIVVWK